MATKTTKKFNAQTATLTEINRELKRLASVKCRTSERAAKPDPVKHAAAIAEYERIDAIKQKRFADKHYIDWTADEIAQASLTVAVKGVKSLQSAKTLYPERHDEILPKLAEWIAHRDYMKELAKFEEMKARFES